MSSVIRASSATSLARRVLLLTCLFCWVRAATPCSAGACLGTTPGAQRIPETAGRTLAGGDVRLPEDTRGRHLVLVFGFGRAAKQQSTLWGRQLLAWQQQGLNFSFYQVAMLSGAPKVMQPFIVHAMRSTVPSIFRPHVLILSSQEDSWRTLIHPTVETDVYIVFCDGGGHIEWETKGAGADRFAQSKERLDDASPGSSE